MKKLVSIAGLVLGIVFLVNNSAIAQNDFTLGGGLAYGSEVEAIGIQAGATYAFTEEISGAADFIIFFPDNYDWWEFNVNVHYRFFSEDNVSVYGLAGLNFVTVDFDQFGSDSELGLNLGGGAEFGLEFAKLYTELKYTLSNFDQLGLSAGLRFAI